jgi:hypothetical protein
VKETIYLRVSRTKVEGMTKNLPQLARGEIPVKLVVEVDPAAFREPVIEHHVRIADWRQGIDIADVELREAIITEEEAALIRERRLAAMRPVLEEHGYGITGPAPETASTDG